MKRLVSLLFLYGILFFVMFPPLVLAQPTPCPADQAQTEAGCIPKDPVGFAKAYYGIGLGFIGGVALLAIIYGGFLVMTSSGNPTQLNKGKSYIYYAIAGLLLTIFGFVFAQVITGTILHIPGFS